MSCTAFCEIGTLQNGDIWRVMSASSHGHTERYDQSTVTLFLESTKPADSICCSEHRLLTGSKTISPQIAPLGHARIAVSVELHMEPHLCHVVAVGPTDDNHVLSLAQPAIPDVARHAYEQSRTAWQREKIAESTLHQPGGSLGVDQPRFPFGENEEVL